jgi:hypothetical protein
MQSIEDGGNRPVGYLSCDSMQVFPNLAGPTLASRPKANQFEVAGRIKGYCAQEPPDGQLS